MADQYCYSKGPAGDYGFRLVPSDYGPRGGEALFEAEATADQLHAAFPDYGDVTGEIAIKSQIAALESQQTPRRLREALTGNDGGWLNRLEERIAALRAELAGPE